MTTAEDLEAARLNLIATNAADQQNAKKGCCYRFHGKTFLKIGLSYFLFLNVALLIFTALTNEPMDEDQKVWWWVFVLSLISNISILGSCYVCIYYSESQNRTNYKSREVLMNNDIAGISTSYKTVATINSQENTVKAPEPSLKESGSKEMTDQPIKSTFMNLTPSKLTGEKTAVTIVDMKNKNSNTNDVPTNKSQSVKNSRSSKKRLKRKYNKNK